MTIPQLNSLTEHNCNGKKTRFSIRAFGNKCPYCKFEVKEEKIKDKIKKVRGF